MIYLYSIIFGIVQGLTEFFPVSSSGHLLIAHKIFPGFTQGLDLTFDVSLHLATLFILVIFYWNDLFRYVRAVVWKGSDANDRRMGWMLALATVPAGVAGYFLDDVIERTTRNLSLVAATLIIGGILFFVVERWGRRHTALHEIGFGRAFLIGCGQAFALIPGISRSGSTIITGLALGLKRDAATHFSFLLAVPIIALAGAKKLLDLFSSPVAQKQDALVFVIGFVTAAGVGVLCIRYLLEHVKTKTFLPFAVYRIALGVLLLLIVFFR